VRVETDHRVYGLGCRTVCSCGWASPDPWPPSPKGRNRRKARRKRTAVDVRVLPSPETMVAVIDAIRSHQPGSRMYQVMTAIAYYAGLRPSEVVMLRPRALNPSATSALARKSL
jgi:integrase